MTIVHHPSEELLVDYVAGALDEGNSLVMATHISRCPSCQESVSDLRVIAGAMLESCDSETISHDARAACLSALDNDPASGNAAPSPATLPAVGFIPATSEPLALYDHGPWRRIGPGIQRCDISVDHEDGTRVFLLKASAGTQMPEHHHTGSEWTCVLSGAFTHADGRFGPGDFDQADATTDHSPIVDEGEDCVCLVALNGSIELRGWFGRLVQPFVRF